MVLGPKQWHSIGEEVEGGMYRVTPTPPEDIRTQLFEFVLLLLAWITKAKARERTREAVENTPASVNDGLQAVLWVSWGGDIPLPSLASMIPLYLNSTSSRLHSDLLLTSSLSGVSKPRFGDHALQIHGIPVLVKWIRQMTLTTRRQTTTLNPIPWPKKRTKSKIELWKDWQSLAEMRSPFGSPHFNLSQPTFWTTSSKSMRNTLAHGRARWDRTLQARPPLKPSKRSKQKKEPWQRIPPSLRGCRFTP